MRNNILLIIFVLLLAPVLFFGCTPYTRVVNQPLDLYGRAEGPQQNWITSQFNPGEVLFLLSFSGGGTRAAAFSYGVLEELRDTQIHVSGQKKRLLDEVDYISSVSGGSFTAAYYALFGDRIFDDYERVFLKNNIQKIIVNGMLNPLNWLRLKSVGFDRTIFAIEYYDRYIFQKGTFGDIFKQDAPHIQINATDLGTGQHFEFTQEMFDLICSDLSTFKVAEAVAASSAVPVVFAPITLKNYSGCENKTIEAVEALQDNLSQDPNTQQVVKALLSYKDKEERKYIHLIDGAISDNLGLQSMINRIAVIDHAWEVGNPLVFKIPQYIVAVVVNAETKPTRSIESSSKEPTISEVVRSVINTQLHRNNLEMIREFKYDLIRVANQLSTQDRIVTPYFIELAFEDIRDMKSRKFFNNIATSLALPADQVNMLREEGRQLLRQSTDFQIFLNDFTHSQ